MGSSTVHGVSLPEGQTGSRFFLDILRSATERFPAVFETLSVPGTSSAFKKEYAEFLVKFEALRINSPRRVEIACFLADTTQTLTEFVSEDGTRTPLAKYIHEARQQHLTIEPTTVLDFTAEAGLAPSIPFEGTTYRGEELDTLAGELDKRNFSSEAATHAVRWMSKFTEAAPLSLKGHKFVLLGAGAELAPTLSLLEAGAEILWVDLSDPEPVLAERTDITTLAGKVVVYEGARNLLTEPAAISAAIEHFAEGQAVHVGMFAYAPGKGRELRLAASMEAIARSLPIKLIRSIGLYISPTIPAQIQSEERAISTERGLKEPVWQRFLRGAKALSPANHYTNAGELAVGRSVVTLQGVGYQAAQYLTKVVVAEAWSAQSEKITLSTNVAGITNTRSLEHPLFQIAFKGAPTFKIKIFETGTTRYLSAMIYLHDILHDQAPGSSARTWKTPSNRAKAVLSTQVHGGVYTLPWAFDPAIRVATLIGASKAPKLLMGLFR